MTIRCTLLFCLFSLFLSWSDSFIPLFPFLDRFLPYSLFIRNSYFKIYLSLLIPFLFFFFLSFTIFLFYFSFSKTRFYLFSSFMSFLLFCSSLSFLFFLSLIRRHFFPHFSLPLELLHLFTILFAFSLMISYIFILSLYFLVFVAFYFPFSSYSLFSSLSLNIHASCFIKVATFEVKQKRAVIYWA